MLENFQNFTGLCPCGSTRSYAECCQPLHAGSDTAETAEALMRSRYCAYVLHLADYLVATTHPEKIRKDTRRNIEGLMLRTQWRGLQVLSASQGGAGDKIGKVEFLARYSIDGQIRTHRELSRFRRHGGRWVYVDGEVEDLEVEGM